MFTSIMTFANNFRQAFLDVYNWFFSPISLEEYLSSINFGGLLGQWIYDKTDKLESVCIVPSELIFKYGLPSILGLVLIKWLMDAFL